MVIQRGFNVLWRRLCREVQLYFKRPLKKFQRPFRSLQMPYRFLAVRFPAAVNHTVLNALMHTTDKIFQSQSVFLRGGSSVICHIIVLNLAVTALTSLCFRATWPNSLNFFRSFKKTFRLWPKKNVGVNFRTLQCTRRLKPISLEPTSVWPTTQACAMAKRTGPFNSSSGTYTCSKSTVKKDSGAIQDKPRLSRVFRLPRVNWTFS